MKWERNGLIIKGLININNVKERIQSYFSSNFYRYIVRYLSDLLNIKSLYLVHLLIFSQINHLKTSNLIFKWLSVSWLKKKKNTLLHFLLIFSQINHLKTSNLISKWLSVSWLKKKKYTPPLPHWNAFLHSVILSYLYL